MCSGTYHTILPDLKKWHDSKAQVFLGALVEMERVGKGGSKKMKYN